MNIDHGDNSCGTTKADLSDPLAVSAEGVVASAVAGCPSPDAAAAGAA
jgi:hypothetical protein